MQHPWRRMFDPRVWREMAALSSVVPAWASMGRRAWAGSGPQAPKSPDHGDWAATAGLRQEWISWPSWGSVSSTCKAWLDDGDLRKLVTIKWHFAQKPLSDGHRALYSTNEKCFHFSARRCMSPGELARGGRGRQQPTPAAGWWAKAGPSPRSSLSRGGHADGLLVLGGGGMMQAWGKGRMWLHPKWEQNPSA